MLTVEFSNTVAEGVCSFCKKTKKELVTVSFADGSIAGAFDKRCFFALLTMKLAPMKQDAPKPGAVPQPPVANSGATK